MVARDGEHGAEWVQWLASSTPSAIRRSRHGSRTEAGSQERSLSWSDTMNSTLGRRAAIPDSDMASGGARHRQRRAKTSATQIRPELSRATPTPMCVHRRSRRLARWADEPTNLLWIVSSVLEVRLE